MCKFSPTGLASQVFFLKTTGFLKNLNVNNFESKQLEDKALCPKLTFWERCVCLYDQALLCYCVHSKAHAWLIDTILDVSARVVIE